MQANGWQPRGRRWLILVEASKRLCNERAGEKINQKYDTRWSLKGALLVIFMELEYTTYRNREGTFYHPSIDVTFKYKSVRFPYKSALVDTGSDFVMLPLDIAEALGAKPDFDRTIELNCACGDSFNSYMSLHPLEIIVDHKGFRPTSWQTHVQFVDARVTVLLGNKGFLDYFDATFYGGRHVLNLVPKS